MAEYRRAGFAIAAGRGPDAVMQRAVPEIAVEPAQLPELIGDVLAGVGHRSIRSHDDLVLVRRIALHGQDPAARVLALGLEAQRPRFLEQLESAVPEVEAQDVALVGEQV